MSFVIYFVSRRGAGYFLAGDSDEPRDIGSTFEPRKARQYKTKAAAAKVVAAIARPGDEHHILRRA
ncbi:hypothetical protein ALQ64_03141 [Pseudomonas cannabina]|uniref:Uncharacterized protein n=1 Tax=Pseudomonas cannabina TaxID=86840 RepID=A0A3M3K201_PSECA|nr:hypothetical protein [Pseudomonas cannabina]RMN17134.1 hypothetical protein ALQ64_03141 [Pseudomonas cannabina]